MQPPLPLQLGLAPLDWILVGLLVAVVAGIAAWYLSMVGWALRKKPLLGAEALVGKRGVAASDFGGDEVGEVSIEGINWRARVFQGHAASGSAGRVSRGDAVVVVGLSALVLEVQRERGVEEGAAW